MHIALLVCAAPSTEAPRSALRFAEAAIAEGHTLAQVFFYGEGASNLNALAEPGGDEFNVLRAWQDLAERHGVRLLCCSASAQRRGVLGADAAKRLSRPAPSLGEGVELVGLGSLLEVCSDSDRLVTFA